MMRRGWRVTGTLAVLAAEYQVLVYVMLFAVIFVETGVVVMPFLPGDSLLFVTGALAAKGMLSLPVLIPLLVPRLPD